MIPDERGLTVFEWTDVIALEYPSVTMKLSSASQWKEWARQFRIETGLEDTPEPEEFDDWRSWAVQLIQALAGG